MGYITLIEKISRLGLAAVRRTKAGREALKKFGQSKKFKEFIKKFNESKSKKQLDKAKDFRTKNIKPKKKAIEGKGGKGGPSKKKLNANKNEGKPNKPKDNKPNKPNDNKPNKPKPNKPNKPKPNKPTDNKSKSFVGKGAAIGGGLLVGAAIIKSKNKDKKTESNKSVPTAPKGFKDKGSPGRGVSKGTAFDDMLGGKSVATKPAGFKNKGSKGRGASAFGNNISFTSKDVKTLRENAKMVKKQIDDLNITSMQKLRLKKLIDTRDKGYNMDESYRRAFNEVKRRVKDNKLNFAIDVSGYAGMRKD